MTALRLLKMGVELEDGEPRFYVRINLATMGASEGEAVDSMQVHIRNNLITLAKQIEDECAKRLTKLYGIQPCSTFTPSNHQTAFQFVHSASCDGKRW